MNRWKNIIDNYKKSERKRTGSGQGAAKTRRYIYAKQLSFLEGTVEAAHTETSITLPEVGLEEDIQQDDDSISLLNQTRDEKDGDTIFVAKVSKKSKPLVPIKCWKTEISKSPTPDEEIMEKVAASKRRRIIEEGQLKFVANSTYQPSATSSSSTENSDDDKLFFDSLIPMLKTLSMDNKLQFRCEVMKLVSQFRQIQKEENMLSESFVRPL